MRMMMIARMPHETFNAASRAGTAGPKLKAILEETRPESVYFTEMDGLRTAVLIVDMESPSQVPALAEPWFLGFNADVEFHVAMTPDDLEQAGLDELGKKWA